MTTATKPMSLEEFFAYDDGTDSRYELEYGELLIMPPESYLNQNIAIALLVYFAQSGILPQYLSMKTEIVVSGARSTVRLPDLLILSEVGAQALEGATRSTITLEMPPPRLVVEVVSPGTENIKRDYRYKKSQYEARGIDEYWIIDPEAQKVSILWLVSGFYEVREFVGEQSLKSSLFPELKLTVKQIFKL